MGIETQKSELINWINRLKDQKIIQEILLLKNKIEGKSQFENKPAGKREFGSGKHLISYIAEDFNDPIDDFEEYTKP